MDSIDYYNLCASTYYKDTVELELGDIREEFIRYLPEEGEILDLGCGSGRDSLYFIDRGFDVTSLEGSEELAELASIHIGQQVLLLNYKDMAFDNVFDGIWACGSFNHSTESEVSTIMNKLYNSLKEEGILYLTLKYGTFEGIKEEVYQKEYKTKEIKKIIDSVEGFKILECHKTDDVRAKDDSKWLHIILKKEK